MHLIIFWCNLPFSPSIRDVPQFNLLFAAVYVYFLQFLGRFLVYYVCFCNLKVPCWRIPCALSTDAGFED